MEVIVSKNRTELERLEGINEGIKEYLLSLHRHSFHWGPIRTESYGETSKALKEIRDRKLYELRGETDFYVYCAKRWGMRPGRVNQYLNYDCSSDISTPITADGHNNPQKQSYVYFIDAGDLVKIGTTKDISKRLYTLQTGSPVRLTMIGFIAGTEKDEKELHARFSSYRSHGEWFNKSADLINYIKDVCHE